MPKLTILLITFKEDEHAVFIFNMVGLDTFNVDRNIEESLKLIQEGGFDSVIAL